MTAQDVLSQIQECVDKFQFEQAHQLCLQLIQQLPNDAKVLETLGSIEVELGDYDNAFKHFQRCIELSPSEGFTKYFYMGQFSQGMEALHYYRKGVDILRGNLTDLENAMQISQDDELEKAELKCRLSTALCSMAEIYLTDCCFEDDAEPQAEALLQEALTLDPNNADTYVTLASFRLSQQRPEEAKVVVERGMSLWEHKDVGDPSVPSCTSRIALTKILLELHLFDKALEVLSRLEKEDDELVDVWYLYGWTYFCKASSCSDNEGEKNTFLEDAKECLLTTKKLFLQFECDDDALLEHVEEMLNSIHV